MRAKGSFLNYVENFLSFLKTFLHTVDIFTEYLGLLNNVDIWWTSNSPSFVNRVQEWPLVYDPVELEYLPVSI